MGPERTGDVARARRGPATSALPADGTGAGASRRGRKPTSTSRFGSSRRESHDASGFYERFVPPTVSQDANVARTAPVDVVYEQDSRAMTQVASGSVALVVTSPPYFAGKEYEASLGDDGVPASYFEYLGLLRDVFAECGRVLEPGGRIAVNVANLGRRPFRSLAGDVTQILEDLGLLLRGEIVWWKGRAAGGSCAWGTFQQPGNPVLRDVTERIIVAGKGRFDRAVKLDERRRLGLPSSATIGRDEFLEATTDLWEIPPESARRVGHPAPFPVPLVRRLIELYTYAGDLVLDPFIGSGTTAVAAVQTGRVFLGYDTDPGYVRRARARIAEEVAIAATTRPASGPCVAVAEALAARAPAREVAAVVLAACGFADVRPGVRDPPSGLELDYSAVDSTGRDWAFELCGAFTATQRSGLRRTEVLWKAIGRAAVLHESDPGRPVVLLATEAPTPGAPAGRALASVRGAGRPVLDVVELGNGTDHDRLRSYAANGPPVD